MEIRQVPLADGIIFSCRLSGGSDAPGMVLLHALGEPVGHDVHESEPDVFVETVLDWLGTDRGALAPGLHQDGVVMIADRLTGTRARTAVVAVVSFLCGVSTGFAQDFLPGAVISFANSASGWTLVTVLLLAWARVRTALAALLGAASFVLLTLGYSAAAHLRDLFYDPTLFVVVGVVVGPFVGIATSWLWTASSWRAATGTALLSGIGLGEAAYGLTVVADTTSPVYWTLVGVVALALLVAMLIRGIRGVLWALLAVVGTGVTASAFVVAYSRLGGV